MPDPREQGPQPPFAEQRQQWPGVESEMQPNLISVKVRTEGMND